MDFDKSLHDAIEQSDATNVALTIAQFILHKTVFPSLHCRSSILQEAWNNYVSEEESATLKMLFDIVGRSTDVIYSYYGADEFFFQLVGKQSEVVIILCRVDNAYIHILGIRGKLVAMSVDREYVTDTEAIESTLADIVTRLIAGD
jgi:hypothetical protein